MANLKVLDSSVIIKWFVNEEDSDKASIFLDEYESQEMDIAVPISLFYEVANALWVKRNEGLTLSEIKSIMQDLNALNLTTIPPFELMDESLEFSYKYEISIYDSVFVVIAQSRKCEFITADEKLYNKLPRAEFPWVKLLKLL